MRRIGENVHPEGNASGGQNAAAAETHADRCGLTLEVVDPRDLSRLARERADVVLDWDYLPEEMRGRLLDGATVNVPYFA